MATIEMIVVGFAIAAMVIPAVMATSALADAQGRAAAAASDGAAWVARHGTQPVAIDPEVQVTYDVDADRVSATARISVALVPLIGAPFAVVVSESVTVPVSPYRSNRA